MAISNRFLGLKWTTGSAYGFCEQINTDINTVPYGYMSVGSPGSTYPQSGVIYFWSSYDKNGELVNYRSDVTPLPGFYFGHRSHAYDSESLFTTDFNNYGTHNPAFIYKDGKLCDKIDVYVKKQSNDVIDTDDDILQKCNKIIIKPGTYKSMDIRSNTTNSILCHFVRHSSKSLYNTIVVNCTLESGNVFGIYNDFYIDIQSYGEPIGDYKSPLSIAVNEFDAIDRSGTPTLSVANRLIDKLRAIQNAFGTSSSYYTTRLTIVLQYLTETINEINIPNLQNKISNVYNLGITNYNTTKQLLSV